MNNNANSQQRKKSLGAHKKPQSHRVKFNLLDYLFFAVGIITSIIIIITDHEHSPIYIFASVVALNSAIIGTILNIKGRRSGFIFIFVNALTYCYVAWISQFYGSFATNLLVYAPCAIVGFYSWGKHTHKNREVIARRLTPKQTVLVVATFVVVTLLLDYVLRALGGQSTLLDSSGNTLVIFASILAALRYQEQWLIWLISDVLQLAMWTTVNDPAMLVLRVFFVVSSVYGFINWRKMVKKSK